MAQDGALKAGVKRLARFFYEADLALHRRRRRSAGERPYDLGGACRLCAKCCEAPAIAPVWPVRRLRSARRLFLLWQRAVNGFHFLREDRAHRVFVFRCEHFDRITRRCDSYETRPGVCRDYPRNLMWQTEPVLLDGCGYRPVAPGAASMLRELEKRNLPKEQMEKLRKGLFLE